MKNLLPDEIKLYNESYDYDGTYGCVVRNILGSLNAAREENEQLMRVDYWSERVAAAEKEVAAYRKELDKFINGYPSEWYVSVLKAELDAALVEIEALKKHRSFRAQVSSLNM